MHDLLIIGGGPAGYNAAERAARAGMDAALFEGGRLGGVCLNEGCIPTKSLLNSAKIYSAAAHGEAFGVTGAVSLCHAEALARKRRVVDTLVGGVSRGLKGAGVRVINERAVLTGRAGGGIEAEAGGEKFAARNVLIATGSAPIVPPIEGARQALEQGFAITSREALELESVPARLAVVGGGVIGLEMAQYYAAAGAQVTVIELLDTVGGPLDTDIAARLRRALEDKGIAIRTGARVTRIGDGYVTFEDAGGAHTLECGKALLCVGRRASAQGIGLEALGVESLRGAVPTDARMRTNIPGVYAAGDVNGLSMLAHTAYREGEVAVNVMRGLGDAMRYDAIPAVIYTSPEVACAGYTLEGARKAGFAAAEKALPLSYSGRFVAESDGHGLMKAVADTATGRLLGLHILGPYASEIIYGASVMIAASLRVKDIREAVFPHPTVGEVLRELMFMFE